MDANLIIEAEEALSIADPVLGNLIKQQELTPRPLRADYFTSICRSIVGQQLSVAAAKTIFFRLETKTQLSPLLVKNLNLAEIKTIGLSAQKAKYLVDIANHFIEHPGIYNHLEKQSDEVVIAELTALKGVGVWSAQMFLIFTLARQDIFAPDDAGLQRAMKILYGWHVLPSKEKLQTVASKWQPYRTVASLHLWQSIDKRPA